MRRLLPGLALVLLTVAVYLPALPNGFVWDDDYHVTENPNLGSLEGLRRIWLVPGATPQYYPLTHTSFWIEHRLWGLDPLGYHLVNVLLHAGAAVLLWRVLRRLSLPGAWLAAAVFAVHPVHVESVAWVSERKNTLSGVFYLASALAYLRLSREAAPGRRETGRALLAFGLFVLALLAKTVTATLPLALALVLVWKHGGLSRPDRGRLGAMLVAGAILGGLTAYLERHHVGAEGREFAFSALDRLQIAGRALFFYLGKLAWPSGLSFVYPKWTIGGPASWAYPLAAVAGLGGLWVLRRRWGAGPFIAAAFFALTLVPALGFFNVFPMRYAFVADHFQYLASIGPIAAIAAGVAKAFRSDGPVAGPPPRLAVVGAAALLLGFGAATWRQTGAYRDAETLWRRTLETNPRAFMAHHNLANLLKARGEVGPAMEHYRRAVEAEPGLVEAWINLGNTLAGLGRWDEAGEAYASALRREPENALALYNLGLAHERMGGHKAALEAYRAAVRAAPGLAEAHERLGMMLYLKGDRAGAVEAIDRARRLGKEPNPVVLRLLTASE